MRNVWIANDGAEFEVEEDCLMHELGIEAAALVDFNQFVCTNGDTLLHFGDISDVLHTMSCGEIDAFICFTQDAVDALAKVAPNYFDYSVAYDAQVGVLYFYESFFGDGYSTLEELNESLAKQKEVILAPYTNSIIPLINSRQKG